MDRPLVLIVAANPFHLSLMADLLEANDIRTIRARGAPEALKTATQTPPTMVVVDLDLPSEESRTIVDGIRNRLNLDGVPVMVVGNKSQRDLFSHVLAGCESTTVDKPIDTGLFPRRVLQEIRRHSHGVPRSVHV